MFDSNQILAKGSSGNRGGGGEWLQGASLTSIADRFSRNTIPGATGGHWSWGGGLGIINSYCDKEAPTESTLEDDVIAGNSIGAGAAADLGGAGAYVGCPPEPAYPNHLRLLDSTVTENSVATAGGIAGIDGHSSDQLVIENSIVAVNNGGPEIGGFNGGGGSLSSAFSDVCDEAGTAPLAGEGNICAAPKLEDEGNTASFDAHETASSPTIDAGSTALVPSGLTTDFYGEPRIDMVRTNVATCGLGGSATYSPFVDMGADEYPPAIPADIPVPACPPPGHYAPGISASVFSFPSLAVHRSGLLALSFTNLAAGRVQALGTFEITRTVLRRVKGRRRHVKQPETVLYGRASYTVLSPGDVRIELKPTKRALALLARRKHLQVRLSITFTATGELPTTHEQTITVRYFKPRVKHRG